MRENDSEVNIQVGVLSGLLQKEVTIKFSVTESTAFGDNFTIIILLLIGSYIQLEKIITGHNHLN